jgi:hypothetical protein
LENQLDVTKCQNFKNQKAPTTVKSVDKWWCPENTDFNLYLKMAQTLLGENCIQTQRRSAMKKLLASLCVFACVAVGCGKETQSENQFTNNSNASGTNVSNSSGTSTTGPGTVTCSADKAKAAAYQAKFAAALLRLKTAESALASAQNVQQLPPNLQQSVPACQSQVQQEPCLEPAPSVDLGPLLKEVADAKLSLELLKAEIKNFLATQKCATSPLW